MLRAHNYPVQEACLSGPLYPELDSTCVYNVVPVAPASTPAPDPAPMDVLNNLSQPDICL